MIVETYTCDKCGKPMQNSADGMYCISHESIGNRAMNGDNRIPREVQFCRNCFGIYIAPLLTKN